MQTGDSILLREKNERLRVHTKQRKAETFSDGSQVLPSFVEIVRSRARFTEISREWNALAEPMGDPLALHTWYEAAVSVTEAAEQVLQFVLVWRGDRLVAAAPLIVDRRSGNSRLVLVDSFLGEPDRLLFADDEALGLLGEGCARQRLPIEIRRLALPEYQIERFASALRKKAWVNTRQRHSTSYVSLPDSFAELEAGMSKQRRSTVRRKIRKAMRDNGSAECELLAPRIEEVPETLERIEDLEEAGWKGRAGTSLSLDHKLGNFVRKLALDFASIGKLRVSILTIGGQDAACRLMLEHANQWFEIKIGYDENFQRYSPGIALMHETLRHACERSIESYHFLGVSEGWHAHWPHVTNADFRLATYPFGLAGARALTADVFGAARLLFNRIIGR